jgi:hypothetical protein
MHVRICEEPAFRLVGHATRVPLIHEGVNPHIQSHVTSIPMAEHLRLKGLSNASPTGLLQISDELDPNATEGSELTHARGGRHGRHVDSRRPGQHRGIGRDLGGVHHAGDRTRRRCRRRGRRPPPNGFRRTRGGCDPGRRSWPSSSTTRTSPPHGASSGSQSNAPDAARGVAGVFRVSRRRCRTVDPGAQMDMDEHNRTDTLTLVLRLRVTLCTGARGVDN